MVNKLRLIHFYLGLYIEDDIKPSKALRLINKYYPMALKIQREDAIELMDEIGECDIMGIY